MRVATPALTVSSCHFQANNASESTLHISHFAVASLAHSWFISNMGVDVALAGSANTNVTFIVDTCIFDGGFVEEH